MFRDRFPSSRFVRVQFAARSNDKSAIATTTRVSSSPRRLINCPVPILFSSSIRRVRGSLKRSGIVVRWIGINGKYYTRA